jgi:hypothetical protein
MRRTGMQGDCVLCHNFERSGYIWRQRSGRGDVLRAPRAISYVGRVTVGLRELCSHHS